jgi:hypothetical protein
MTSQSRAPPKGIPTTVNASSDGPDLQPSERREKLLKIEAEKCEKIPPYRPEKQEGKINF